MTLPILSGTNGRFLPPIVFGGTVNFVRRRVVVEPIMEMGFTPGVAETDDLDSVGISI